MVISHLWVMGDMSSKTGSFKRAFVWVLLTLDTFISANECLENGLYAHPRDCATFYSCAPYGPVLMRCPPGLHFNRQILSCDWPHNSGCTIKESSSDIQETDCPIYPHPTDCARFYLCSPSGHVSMDCPSGLHFNPRLLVCDWPEGAGCTDRAQQVVSSSVEETTVEELGEFAPVALETTSENGEGTVDTVEETETVDTMTEETFTISSAITADDQTNTFYASTLNNEETTKLDISTTFENIEESTREAEEESVGTSLVSSGQSETFTQTEATTFKISTQSAEVTNPTDYKTSTVNSVTTDPTETPLTDSTTFATSTLHVEGPDAFNDSSSDNKTENSQVCNTNLQPHPSDCNKFYMISPAGDLELSCPSSLLFNPLLLVCDWAANVKCNEHSTATTQMFGVSLIDSTTSNYDETGMASDNTEFTVTHLIGTEPTTSERLEPLCESSIWAHPTDCTKFFMCDSTGPMEQLCPEGLGFNPDLLVCDWQGNVDCTNKLTSTPSSEFTETSAEPNLASYLDSDVESTTKDSTILCESDVWPHPTDCTKFFMCDSTGPMEQLCPEGLGFNPDLLVCDWQGNVDCTNKLTSTSSSEFTETSAESNLGSYLDSDVESSTKDSTILCERGVWPHPTDCARFFKCTSTVPVESICPDELRFNPALLACDRPSNFECAQNVSENYTETTTTESKSNISTNSSYLETPTVQQETTTRSTSLSNEHNNRNLCKNSIWPHPTDCAKFFRCDAGGPMETRCPDDLLFNPALLVCDWPENFVCPNAAQKRTSNRGVYGSSPRQAPPNEICSRNLQAFFLIPDPVNCRSFLICDHGITYKGDCPAQSLFNKVLNACVAFKDSDRVDCMT